MGKIAKPIIAVVLLLGSIVSPVSPAVGSDSSPTVSVTNYYLYDGPVRNGDRIRSLDTVSLYPEGGVAQDYLEGGKHAGKSWSYRLLLGSQGGSRRVCDGRTITSNEVPFTVQLKTGLCTNPAGNELAIDVNDSRIELGLIGDPIWWNTIDRTPEYLVGQTFTNLCDRPPNYNVVHAVGGQYITTCSYTLTESDIGKTWSSISLNILNGELSVSSNEVLQSLRTFTTVPTASLTGSGLPNTVISCRFAGSFSPNPTTRTTGLTLDGSLVGARRTPGTYTYTYTVRPSDVGKLAGCSDQASRTGYQTREVTSPTNVRILGYGVTPPTISGTPNPGSTLESSVQGWGSDTSINYQWLRDGLQIAGETSSSYIVRSSDVAKIISLRITGTRTGVPSATLTSAGITVRASTISVPTPSASSKAAPTPSASSKAAPNSNERTQFTPSSRPTPSAQPEAPNASSEAGNQLVGQDVIRLGTIPSSEPLEQKMISELPAMLKPVDTNIATNRATAPQYTLAPEIALRSAPGTANKRLIDLPSLVQIENQVNPSRILIIEDTTLQVVTESGGVLSVQSQDVQGAIPVDITGRVQMVRSNSVETEGVGLKPNSEFAVYLFSEPILLGTGKTDSLGNFYASFVVENKIPLGQHTLQVNGILANGKSSSISLPVVVVESAKTLSRDAMPSSNPEQTDSPVALWIIGFLVLLAIGASVFVIQRKYNFKLVLSVKEK
jgi:hypothetical protein